MSKSSDRVSMLGYFICAFLLRGNRYFCIRIFPGASSRFWPQVFEHAQHYHALALPSALKGECGTGDFAAVFKDLLPHLRQNSRNDHLRFSCREHPFFEQSDFFLLPDEDKRLVRPLVLSALAYALEENLFEQTYDERSNAAVLQRAFSDTREAKGLPIRLTA